jgi:DNA polymerase III alpha subunit
MDTRSLLIIKHKNEVKVAQYMSYGGEPKDKGIKTIPGVEVYFFDKDLHALYPQANYFSINLYAPTFEAFLGICKLTGRDVKYYTDKLDNELPLWGWAELETLKGLNIEAVLAGPHSMGVKPVLQRKRSQKAS